MTRRLGEMVATGWPVLVSLSNKDFVGRRSARLTQQRLTGTLAATSVCALAGAWIYRVHQVPETRATVDMVVDRGRRPPLRDPAPARRNSCPACSRRCRIAGQEDPVPEVRRCPRP